MVRLTTKIIFALFLSFAGPVLADDFEQTIHTTPDSIPPALGSAGTHPCIIATSAGFSITGFAVAGGSGHVADGCEDRNTVALIYNMGEKQAAFSYLCLKNPEVNTAFGRVGKNCFDLNPQEPEADYKEAELIAKLEQKNSLTSNPDYVEILEISRAALVDGVDE